MGLKDERRVILADPCELKYIEPDAKRLLAYAYGSNHPIVAEGWGFSCVGKYFRMKVVKTLKLHGLLKITKSGGFSSPNKVAVNGYRVEELRLTGLGRTLGELCAEHGNRMPPFFKVNEDGSVDYGFEHEFGEEETLAFSLCVNPSARKRMEAAKEGDPVTFVKKPTKSNPESVTVCYGGKKIGVIHAGLNNYEKIALLFRAVPERLSGIVSSPLTGAYCRITIKACLPQ